MRGVSTRQAVSWIGLTGLLVLVALFFSACGHTPTVAANCQELDWYELGRTDGLKGSQALVRRPVKVICADSDASLSEALYNNGFDSGVSRYCSYNNGFELGRAGQTKNESICPSLLHEDFARGYDQGRRFGQLERTHSDINRRIEGINDGLRDKTIDIARRGLMRGQKIELFNQKQKIELEMSQMQKSTAIKSE